MTPPRPPGRFVRLVLALRVCWLAPVTLMALVYAGYTLLSVLHLMRFNAAAAFLAFLNSLFGLALAAAFLYFTWRMWRKTWDMLTGRIIPEPSAPFWQAAWIVLAVILPLMVVWPKVKDLQRYGGEGANKGALASLRIAAQEYKAARGAWPSSPDELVKAGLIKAVPALWDKRGAGFPHPPTSSVVLSDGPRDTGGWAYSVAGDSAPLIFIDCTHADSRGTAWSYY